MSNTRAFEAGRHDTPSTQPTGLPIGAVIALFVWLMIVSFLITGYKHIYGANHSYQLVMVQKLNDPTLYPNDAFADTTLHYAAPFWYIVAWLSRLWDVSVVLFVLFVIGKFLFLFAGYRLGRTFFPNSTYAPIVGMATMTSFPQLLFGGGYLTDSTQQTPFAIATLLLTLDAFLNKRWYSVALWLGISINLNLMFAVYGITYLFVSWLIYLRKNFEIDYTWKSIASFLMGMVVGAPAIYLVYQASAHAEYDSEAVWKTTELCIPTHFYPHVWGLYEQLLALLLACILIFIIYRFRDASKVGGHLIGWTIVAVGWYLLAWSNILWFHSVPLLHLHPVRAIVLWQLASMIFVVCFLLYLVQKDKDALHRFSLCIWAMVMVFIAFIDDILDNALSLALIVSAGIICEVGRRVLLRRLAGSSAFLLTLTLISVMSFTGFGIFAFASKIRAPKRVAYFTLNEPAITVAEWANKNTSKESVFLVPIHNHGGWHRFRHLSQRNVFVTAKDGTAWTYAPWYAHEWLERMKALGLYEVLGVNDEAFAIGRWVEKWTPDEKNFVLTYDKVDDEKVQALKKRYRIDYWITRATVKTRYPKVYEHSGWQVLRVNDSM